MAYPPIYPVSHNKCPATLVNKLVHDDKRLTPRAANTPR
jgi:hypothetical protein